MFTPSLYFANGRCNPAYLKLDLYCKGLKIDGSCLLDAEGRRVIRNRAGLGSGLELIVGRDMACNTPILEKWVARTPFLLVREDESGGTGTNAGSTYAIYRTKDGSPARGAALNRDQAKQYASMGLEPEEGPKHDPKTGRITRAEAYAAADLSNYERVDSVILPVEPRWYSWRTSTGALMSRIGCLQGTYLGVYWGPRCNNWAPNGEAEFCKFCTEGQNLGREEDLEKTVDDLVETVIAARQESGITFVHFNCGYVDGNAYWELLEPAMRAVKDKTGLLVGMQAPPEADFDNYRRAKDLGVNNMSFCFEVLDPARFAEIGPGKARRGGLQRYLDAIDFCANQVGFDTVNGEIIAGLESQESSIQAIDWIVDHGAIPTVCVHRPLKGAAYQDLDPPAVEEMVPIFGHMYDRCIQNGLPIGIAPNVHVSLILMPDECRYLSTNPDAKPLTRAKNALMHRVFTWIFNNRWAKVRVLSDSEFAALDEKMKLRAEKLIEEAKADLPVYSSASAEGARSNS